MLLELLLIVLVCSLISTITVIIIRKFASKLKLIAIPNNRSSHKQPIPQGAGIGISLSVVVVGIYLANDQIIFSLNWLILCFLLLIITIIGLLDDIYTLSSKKRLLIQTVIIVLLIFLNLPAPVLILPGNIILDGWLLMSLLIFAGIWWINLYNFMDGIDGLAGSQAIFMLTSGVILALLEGASIFNSQIIWMIGAITALVVFINFNWQPAKIFLGDSGSLFLGLFIFSSAILTIKAGWLNYPAWSILAAYFVCDATVTLIVRFFLGENIFQPHLKHLFQRLAIRWGAHNKVTTLTILINVIWLFPLALMTKYFSEPNYQLLLVILAYVPIIALYLFFLLRINKDGK